jgi:Copper amine oxidase, enzyme domain
VSNAAQQTVRNVAGTVRGRVLYGGQTVWRFHVLRPAASTGTNGSGVELRYVDYRGKRVLYRAHVPVVNVNYEHHACEPHRDWQNEEGMFDATGTEIAPGFRQCTGPARTIVDTGSDTGNFAGVAIYIEGLEVVIVSQMEAGWYRYTSEWRLHMNGTIRPRFGFSAVSSPCVCARHFHHIYWRFDFDIRTAARNRVCEYNDPPLIGPSNWHTAQYEVRRPRDPARQRKWRVENTSTGEGYEILPGEHDGIAAALPDWPFGRGDLWVLRYRGSEVDDGVIAVGPPCAAPMNNWLRGEAVSNHDVVVWYGAHFEHDVATEPAGIHGHVLGPTLKPVNW